MKNQDFIISSKAIWFLVIINTLLTVLGAFARLYHVEYSQILIPIGIMLFLSTWLVILSEMVKNKIFNKTFWIMSMFILPTITPLFYMIQRNKLLIPGDN
jgi:hypothetical protein